MNWWWSGIFHGPCVLNLLEYLPIKPDFSKNYRWNTPRCSCITQELGSLTVPPPTSAYEEGYIEKRFLAFGNFLRSLASWSILKRRKGRREKVSSIYSFENVTWDQKTCLFCLLAWLHLRQHSLTLPHADIINTGCEVLKATNVLDTLCQDPWLCTVCLLQYLR